VIAAPGACSWSALKPRKKMKRSLLDYVCNTMNKSECCFDEIFSEAFNLTTSFWTAANDHGHERNFYWESTGEFLAIHSDWGVDEPDNIDGEEHCVLLDNDQESDGTFRWSDKPCSLRKRFVCELNATIANIN
jgi:hypothetical protein